MGNTPARFLAAKGKARRCKQTFTLTQAEYADLIAQPCHYCRQHVLEGGVGLDRIDNDLGYVAGNCLPCCGDHNKLRGDRLTVDETLVAVQAIMAFRHRTLT